MSISETLAEGMDLSIAKEGQHSAAVALSESGAGYRGAFIDAETNLLGISAEQVALLMATQHLDYRIREVVAQYESTPNGELASPLVLKIMVDFARRTGQQLGYRVLNYKGDKIFQTDDVREQVAFYQPKIEVPAYVSQSQNRVYGPNNVPIRGEIDKLEDQHLPRFLSILARHGVDRAFLIRDGATRYGAVALTGNRQMAYFSGNYSSYDHRLSIHAEMGAVLAVLMSGEDNISHLGLLSPKFGDSAVPVCGCCRQFIIEISKHLGIEPPSIHCLAYQTNVAEQYSLPELLPNVWSSKVER